MDPTFINYGLAFIEGLALILSPCILPILPIMLSGSIVGGNRRPLGIVCGFIIVFSLFTFFSRLIVQYIGVNLDTLRQVAYILIAIFGLILVSDYLSEKFSSFTQKIANIGVNFSNTSKSGFFSGVLLGGLVSLVWVPCGGPILAAAIVQGAVQKTSWQSFLTFFFFALGSAAPMFIIALLGRKITKKVSFLKTKTGLMRKIFGVIIITAALISAYWGTSGATFTMPEAPNVLPPSPAGSGDKLINGLAAPYPAPSLKDNSVWINSSALNVQSLRGKVVLIDFWTYSCINCVRTLPYLERWYDKYNKEGLVIIGVHSPEFEFEKDKNNVKEAVAKYGIHYPVALDNNYGTWLNYNNQYWPADYLIDKSGMVVYQHFGEGDYDEAEHNIRILLGLKTSTIKSPAPGASTILVNQTPETYLGYERVQNFYGSQPLINNQSIDYTFPKKLPQNGWGLQGKWTIRDEKIISAGNNAAIKIHFFARRVFVVLGSVNKNPETIEVRLNGKLISQGAGGDIKNSVLNFHNHGLYEVVHLQQASENILELRSALPNAEFYTFTFGN